MTRDADVKAVVRARARRRGVSYTAARRDLQPPGAASTLHITNGDSAAMTIRETGLAGPAIAWRDILHEGPVPAGPTAELRAARAQFLAGWTEAIERADAPPNTVAAAQAGARSGDAHRQAMMLRELEQRDATLLAGHERSVLWFEADLYDQLQLIQVLDMLAEADVAPERIELVSAGEFPGVAHFGGLGELTAESLARLYEQRVTLTAEAVALARRAWAAFRAPEPTDLAALAMARSRELRFLGESIARLHQEYPWRGDGLSLTERRILQSIGDEGASAGELFRRVWAREPRPFQGDHVVYAALRALATCPHPLLELAGDDAPFARRRATLTEMGRFALAGSFVHLTVNEPSRWIGGVHLTPKNPWRYDPRHEHLIPR